MRTLDTARPWTLRKFISESLYAIGSIALVTGAVIVCGIGLGFFDKI